MLEPGMKSTFTVSFHSSYFGSIFAHHLDEGYEVMSKAIILFCLAASFTFAQEKTSYNVVTSTSGKYQPADVKVLGVLDYGHSQYAVDRTSGPRYRAFIFSGYGRDRVEITLRGATPGTPFILTDSTLNAIGGGSSQATVSLPYRGPDIEVYYIVFPASGRPAHVSVQVKKVGKVMPDPRLMSEMQGPSSESNRQGEFE